MLLPFVTAGIVSHFAYKRGVVVGLAVAKDGEFINGIYLTTKYPVRGEGDPDGIARSENCASRVSTDQPKNNHRPDKIMNCLITVSHHPIYLDLSCI